MLNDYIKYIKLFGVKYGSSEEEIKEAYKKMAKVYHPDRGGSEEKFKELNSGYEYLKNYGHFWSMTSKQKIVCFVSSIVIGVVLLMLLSSLVVVSSAMVLFVLFTMCFIGICMLFYYLFVFGIEEEVVKLKKIK